tara:strand:+ start:85 stop:249 length:165 start_codon:yes stop_codon:yes gene_type:complete
MAKHYTVGYHEQNREHKDICTYADNSFEAHKVATEDVQYLHEHPQSIDSIMIEQ